MKQKYILSLFLFLFLSCNPHNEGSNDNSTITHIRNTLNAISGKGILFGHYNDLAYGLVGGNYSGVSDVEELTGKYPALFGWDLGNIGNGLNIEGIPFDSIRSYMLKVHQRGGINVVSWHAGIQENGCDSVHISPVNVESVLQGGSNHGKLIAQLDLIAGFIKSVKTQEGELVPVIFRPWSLVSGDCSWWGSPNCSDDDYKKLFRFSVDYIRDKKGLKNVLIAFSPGSDFNTKEDYLKRYAGDEYVDILGLNDYYDFTINRLDLVVKKISIIVDLSEAKNKIPAFTETGPGSLEIANWYTSNLLQVLNASEKTRKIAYVMVGGTNNRNHFFIPFQGQEQVNDFKSFVNNKMIILLDNH